MPIPLIIFLAGLVKKGQYVPNNFLTEFELSMMDLDSYGRINSISEAQISLIIGAYIIIKVLVGKMLLNPKNNGLIPATFKSAFA
jgi:hypothetical protein